ncbi:Disease resistance protein (CC-NBS-LRR class) family [Rhynchospora pubera]|uniref:Disease resistance protein (CC-NBS-LRR class) family n=1 Tax=Rhynchospora pubera TaxID=906938 RepID=A0AAV8F0K6_9POAL|nr:Disease resistance protein (CC-NBS-LRR class) family [Rhynchospora pubera]
MLATKVTILVTTRNISVARIMQTMNPLNLGYLSDDKCWLLFTHYAFQRIDPSNRASFVEIGKKLVEKCNGLPLAVKLIASLLIHEEELQSWIEVLQNDLWESDAGDKALAPLQLSYERLPTYLKQCLLLCSMFPKGHMYSMKLMSRLWIANGYIVAKGRKQIEEVAADYTKMLYERSFFDEYNIKMDIGYLLPVDTTFRLHDLVHELARLNLKKTWTSVKLIREPVIFKEECHLYLKLEGKLSGLPQRLCSIQTVVLRITWINPFLKLEEREKNNNILNNLLNAEHLRVLDLEYPTDDVPHFSLGKLKHLRYLSLRHGLFVVRISPESIFSCYNLRILILDIINIHMKLEGIGNLINLEFLQLFMYPRDLPESLGLLKKLRVLELHEHKNYHAGYYGNYDWNFLLPESIGNLVELQRIVIISLPIKKLPKSFCKLTNMKELILQNCFLEELPEDFRKLIPNCMMNICHLKKQPDNFFGAVGWLMEFNDLKGALLIQDIQNITSIADVKNANLINKCNLKTLLLSWNNTWDCSLGNLNEQTLRRDCLANKDILGIIIGHSEKCNSLNELDIDILDKFQPHPNLKHLYICAYPASEFPRWMGDPLSCASLVKLSIKSCSHIRSLPLGKVISLKHLNISVCDKLLHLKRGSLPTQLKHLTIYWCEILVEVELVESLVELEISTCRMLQSLTKKMPDTAQESSNFVSNYRHFEPSELKSLPSLKKMTIAECEKLVINVNQVVLAENCEVNIRNCSNLSDWCFQHNFKYDSDEPKKEHSIRGSLTCFGYPRRDMFQELTDLYGRPRRLMRGSEVLSLDGPPRRLPGGPINCTLSRQLRRTC